MILTIFKERLIKKITISLKILKNKKKSIKNTMKEIYKVFKEKMRYKLKRIIKNIFNKHK
jgi:hypothetical protein